MTINSIDTESVFYVGGAPTGSDDIGIPGTNFVTAESAPTSNNTVVASTIGVIIDTRNQIDHNTPRTNSRMTSFDPRDQISHPQRDPRALVWEE